MIEIYPYTIVCSTWHIMKIFWRQFLKCTAIIWFQTIWKYLKNTQWWTLWHLAFTITGVNLCQISTGSIIWWAVSIKSGHFHIEPTHCSFIEPTSCSLSIATDRLNVNMSSVYTTSHYKDKTVTRPSYLYHVIAMPGKAVFILKRGPEIYIRVVAESCKAAKLL